ncbi:MAG: hypothetical protein ACI4PW_05255 [Alphaproteobacteria bacterium]|jgi:hypothetical protein|nr:MAG TPA: putative protease [Caudoviricetes sp.]
MNNMYENGTKDGATDAEWPEGISQEYMQDLIDDEALESFNELAESLALSPEQAEGVWMWMMHGAARFVAQFNRKAADYCCDVERDLHETLGPGYEGKIRNAARLVRQYGGDELVDFLRDSGVGNRREVISFLIRLADMMGEDKGLVGEKSALLSSADALKAEIARLMAEPAYMQGRHPAHEQAVQKVYGLRKRLFNEEK